MPNEEKVRLRRILKHAREAVQFTHGLEREDLESDRVLELALARLVELISDGAARVSEEARERHPAAGWAQIIGLRSRLIHEDDPVDVEVLWYIVKEEIPSLIAGIEEAIGPGASS